MSDSGSVSAGSSSSGSIPASSPSPPSSPPGEVTPLPPPPPIVPPVPPDPVSAGYSSPPKLGGKGEVNNLLRASIAKFLSSNTSKSYSLSLIRTLKLFI